MPIFLIIVGLIVAIIVLTVKYFKTYARIASHDAYDAAAKKKAEKLKREDPIISCDYCGAKIDTRVMKTCPQCGAAYDADKEWLERHDPNAQWIEINSKDTASKEIKLAEAKAKKIAKTIRIIIYVLVGMLVFLIGIAIIPSVVRKHTHGKFIKNEVLNEYSFEHYEPVAYGFDTEPVVFEDFGVKITVDGIYRDEENNRLKIGFVFENTTSEPLNVLFMEVYLNRIQQTGSTLGGWLPKNSSVTVYMEAYRNAPETVKSIRVSDFRVYGVGSEMIYQGRDKVSLLTTNADFDDTPIISEELIAFENEKVTIAVMPLSEDAYNNDYSFRILNKTDCTLLVDSSDSIIINDNKYDVYGLYKDPIPAGCVYTGGRAYSYEDAFRELKEDDIVQLSFSFTSEEDPLIDFSTGYFELKR